jgi:pimeloyl-ACP methyl ester carboxylesterase
MQASDEKVDGALLAGLGGARPDAPGWFLGAVAAPYENRSVVVGGATITYQLSGKPGAPGLLFAHGNGAHAHWWDFIAPYFAADYRIAAINFSGMGDSDWRPAYSLEGFSDEQIAVADHAGLFDAAAKPIIIGHSFGGFVTGATAARVGQRLGGAMILDSPVQPPGEARMGPPGSGRPHRVYDSLNAALARFRLAPPQTCETLYAVDYIARWSLKRTGDGWVWKFDPELWRAFKSEYDPNTYIPAAACGLAFIRGAESSLVTDRIWSHIRAIAPPGTPLISLPEAQHHLLLDQPLATVTAIRAVLASWR